MKKTLGYRINILLFLLPALFLFIGVLIAPIALNIEYSLFDWKGLNRQGFIWFENYVKLFKSPIYDVGNTIKNALLLAAVSTFIQLPFALWIALKLSKKIPGERAFVSIYFMPVMISTVVIGMLWKNIFNENMAISKMLKSMGVLEKPLLADKKLAIWAVFVPTVWQYVGYHMLLMYAAIKSVPPELSEAGMLDGCTEGQLNRRIIIPYIKPILRVSVIFAVTGSLKSYDLIAIMIGDSPKSAWVPSMLMFNQLFKANAYGRGSAIAVMLIILCFGFAIIINQIFKGDDTL